MSRQVTLMNPDFLNPFYIHTQKNKPLPLYSRKLNQAQLNYTIIKQELLSNVEILREYRDVLLGHNTVIFIDH
jgi:hypothetical protein